MENNWDNWNNRDDRGFSNRRDNWNDPYDRRREDDMRREDERRRYENMQPQDPDTYRGAYRFDNSSDHHNVSTYNGFGELRHPDERRHQMDDRRMNRRDMDDNYRRQQHRDDFRNERYHDDNRQRSNEPTTPGWRNYMDHSDEWGRGNFDSDYGPDHYPHRRGENIGNMAGTLSYGYDGDRVSNPDADRRFNPLTGEIRNEQPNRHKRNIGSGQSSYRIHDLNQYRSHY